MERNENSLYSSHSFREINPRSEPNSLCSWQGFAVHINCFVSLPTDHSVRLAGGKRRDSRPRESLIMKQNSLFAACCSIDDVCVLLPDFFGCFFNAEERCGGLCSWQAFSHKTARLIHLLNEHSIRLADRRIRDSIKLIFSMMELRSLFGA